MTTVYAVMFEEPDSYDIGSHDQVLILVKDEETGERIIDGLIGKPMLPYPRSRIWSQSSDLRVEEVEVWG